MRFPAPDERGTPVQERPRGALVLVREAPRDCPDFPPVRPEVFQIFAENGPRFPRFFPDKAEIFQGKLVKFDGQI